MKAISFISLSLALAAPLLAVEKRPYHLAGIYTDTCTCSIPCVCDLAGGGPDSCKGVGAVAITKGDYCGADLSGVRFAYALDSGNWLRLYIDAPDAARRASTEKFLRVLCADWGKLESVSDAKVEISGKDGGYAVQVDAGKVMAFVIAPILGGDGKTPLAHTNTHGAFTSTFLQGKSAVASSFHDGARSFDIPAGRNGYFNDKVDSGGSL